MANIKISELDELQKATDQDLLVIVDVANNETKKIQAGNLGTGGAEIPIGPTPPENPKDGDFWIDTSANGETYGDTLPIGAMVEYNGTTVPQGYEKVSDNNIIESGSNENGNWIKYSDGTMICYQSFTCNVNYSTKYGSGYYAEITNEIKSFPVSFIETPKVSVGLVTNYGIGCALRDTNTEKCATNIFVYTFASRTDTITLNIIAIGKWK